MAETCELAGEYVCTEVHVTRNPMPCTAAPLNLKTGGKSELQGCERECVPRQPVLGGAEGRSSEIARKDCGGPQDSIPLL